MPYLFFLWDVCVLNILPRFSCWPSQRPLPPTIHGGLDKHCLQRTMNIEPIPGTVKWVVNRLKSVKRGVLGPCFVLFFIYQNWKEWNKKEKWGKKRIPRMGHVKDLDWLLSDRALHLYFPCTPAWRFICYCRTHLIKRQVLFYMLCVPFHVSGRFLFTLVAVILGKLCEV